MTLADEKHVLHPVETSFLPDSIHANYKTRVQ